MATKNTYPATHPYSWTVIGSMADLDAASLNDVKEWFKTYYGPNNAVIVLAGDITPEIALEKVKKYFGDIPPGPPIGKQQEWIAKMSSTHRQVVQDRVPQARLMMIWNIPGWGTEQETYLDLLADVLTSGKSSRLYKRLVYDDQLTSNVAAYIDNKEIGGQLLIQADAKPGVPLDKVESVIEEELQKLMKEGVNQEELNKVKTQYFANFIKGMERIGGFGGKSDILAQNEVYGGSPDYYKKVHNWIKSATGRDLQKAATDWLSDGKYALQVLPFPDLKSRCCRC